MHRLPVPAIGRLFLFGARDVWFVVALPVYLSTVFGWSVSQVGAFLAAWVIGYGVVQSFAPQLTGKRQGRVPDGRAAFAWAAALAVVPALIALGLASGVSPWLMVPGGLLVFGALFAVNSSLHSYLIVSWARADGVSLDRRFICSKVCDRPFAGPGEFGTDDRICRKVTNHGDRFIL